MRASSPWLVVFYGCRCNETSTAPREYDVNYPEADLARIQDITNEVIVRGACEDKMHAKVYHSMISYREHYANWRDITAPFNMSRTVDNLPSLKKSQPACSAFTAAPIQGIGAALRIDCEVPS